jgi:hypothetical protein
MFVTQELVRNNKDEMNMRDYPILHLSTNQSKGTSLILLLYILKSQ